MGQEDIDASLFPDPRAAKEADEVWSGGQKANENDNPVGNFTMSIVSVTLGRAASSGRLQIHYELEILTGESKGVVLNKYDGLGTTQQAKISQSQLKRLGIDTGKVTLKTLPAVLLDLKGKMVLAKTQQNGEFYNIYFQRLVTESIEGGGATKAGAPAKAGGGASKPRKF